MAGSFRRLVRNMRKQKERSFQDDLDPNPVAPIVKRAANKKGGTYWLKIAMARGEAGRFIRELWEWIGGCTPSDDEDALGEWTHRGLDFRTTYDQHDGAVFIRTHAWTPEADTNTLADEVLSFLRSRGMVV